MLRVNYPRTTISSWSHVVTSVPDRSRVARCGSVHPR